MRTASFFFISVALHAAALAYPVLHKAPEKTPPVVVSIVEAEGGGGGGENSVHAEKPGGAPGVHSAPQKPMSRPRAQNASPPRDVVAAAPVETARATEPAPIAASTEPVALPSVETQTQSAIAIPIRESAVTVALEGGAALSSGTAAMGSSGESSSTGAGSGRGLGSGSGLGSGMGSGSGSGTGGGNGAGKGNGESRSVKASYSACPRPETPEIARKNRWEGTTKLRVLVDEKGRPAIVELYESSGFPTLDHAAIDNIKQRCLFHPAREGEKAVQSWIRIPVIFPLAANQK